MSYETAEGVRRSDLWVINKSPLHFRYHMEHRNETSTQALTFGRAVHKYILEQEQFYDEFTVCPEINRRTKEGREQWQFELDYAEEHGLTIITAADKVTINEIREALLHNEQATKLLAGEHEKEFYWHDDLTGEKCKCKVDCVTEYDGKPYIVDYKTVTSCDDGAFERDARKYGYQFQAGMYCEGAFQNTFVEHGFAFVAQEKTAPYAARVYVCDPEWIKRGYDKFRELIGIYHDCRETGRWYGYEGRDGLPVELVEG